MKRKYLAACLGFLLFSLPFGGCAPEEEKEERREEEDTSVYAVELPESLPDMIASDEKLGTVRLAPVATKDGAETEASFTYEVSDEKVASVDENGVLTARGAGTVTVTATYTAPSKKSASDSVTVRVFADALAEQINSFDEKYVNLYGRFDREGEELDLDNIASGIEVAFFGTELKVELSVTPPANSPNVYGRVFIDGEMQEFSPVVSGETVLAQDLEEGIHTVSLYKSSESDEGRISVKRFSADRFLAIPEKTDLKIEFIGDSITCGYGDLVHGGEGVYRSPSNSDVCLGYAFLTGRALSADFSFVSYSGICVKAPLYSSLTMSELHTYSTLQTKKPHTYDKNMDIVVLNLGTNDASYIDANRAYAYSFQTDYEEFLQHLLDVYPKAHIVCCYGMMGLYGAVNSGIRKAVESFNDPNITYLIFPADSNGVNGHPYRDAHERYAKTLTEHLRKILSK